MKKDATIGISKKKKSYFSSNEICASLSSLNFPSASSLWDMNLHKIHEASHITKLQKSFPTLDKDHSEAKTMQELLFDILHPKYFRRGMLHIPPTRDSTHEIMKQIIHKIEKCLVHRDKEKSTETCSPLRIVVVGGSTTSGRNCIKENIEDKICAWPNRFQELINQFAGKEVIKVYNLGIGATTTKSTGSIIVGNSLYGDKNLETYGPDVIINSYSTNDSQKMKETIKEDNEDFIRIALYSGQCGNATPLVVHLDDYFGLSPFWPHKVTKSMHWKETILKLAKWYDTGVISYADVARDLVYQDTSDDRFYNDQNLHYGHWPHQIIAWTLGFASFELISNYCSDEEERRAAASLRSFERKSYVSKERRFYLMPRLTDDLSMDNITLTMKDTKTASYEEKCESNTTKSKSCALSLTQFRLNDGAKNYKQEMQNFMTKYGGAGGQWKVMQDGGKTGWSTSTPKSSFTLSFDAFEQDVNTVTILYLQSYGVKWLNSKAKFTLSADIKTSQGKVHKKDEFGLRILWQGFLVGQHVETFTDIKSFEVHLTTPIPSGTKAMLNVNLASGSSFKITGLMFCNKSPNEWQTNVKDSQVDCSKST